MQVEPRMLGPLKGAFAWTAVCEPPRLSALVCWEHPDTWHGGGYFLDERTLWVHVIEGQEGRNATRHVPSRNVEKLYNVKYATADPLEPPSFIKRMARDGWDGRKNGLWETKFWKHAPDRKTTLHRKDGFKDSRQLSTYCMVDERGQPFLDEVVNNLVTWADWDPRGRLLVAKGGQIVEVQDRERTRALVDLRDIHVPGRMI